MAAVDTIIAFEVAVRQWPNNRTWHVYVWPTDDTGDEDAEMSFGPFATEADANTHADLVLAALKGATRE